MPYSAELKSLRGGPKTPINKPQLAHHASSKAGWCGFRREDWEAHLIASGGEYVLSNLEALCRQCRV